jgi:hypothetical protein
MTAFRRFCYLRLNGLKDHSMYKKTLYFMQTGKNNDKYHKKLVTNVKVSYRQGVRPCRVVLQIHHKFIKLSIN